MRDRNLKPVVVLTVVILAALGLGMFLAGAAPPAGGPALSPAVPRDVAAAQRQDDFDLHSWALFVALNSPAGQGGKKIGDEPGALRVWETFEDPLRIFSGSERAARFPQVLRSRADRKVFYLGSSGTELFAQRGASEHLRGSENLQAGSSWPLIDQLGNYAVYETRLNPLMTGYITGNGLTTAKRLGEFGDLDFPDGSLVVKAAWRIFPRSWPQEKPEILARYYWTKASIVVDDSQAGGGTGSGFTIEQVPVGLVGFHIIQKTARQPQWIWTTFEQADNYEVVDGPPGLTPTYNDGKSKIGDVGNNRQPLLSSGSPPPSKYVYLWNRPADLTTAEYTPLAQYTRPQIQRTSNEMPLPEAANRTWQGILPAPWKHYRLMVTQWTEGGKPGGRPLPRNPDNVSIARNTVLESYLLGDQTLASQVPPVKVRDDGSNFSLPDSSLDDMILATIEAGKYPPTDATGPLTWSSCMLCHEVAQCDTQDKNGKPVVVLTDFSMLYHTYLAEECTP